MRYAMIEDFRVIGCFEWDGQTPCAAFDGYLMVRCPYADIGDWYDPITKSIYNPELPHKRVGEYQLGE